MGEHSECEAGKGIDRKDARGRDCDAGEPTLVFLATCRLGQFETGEKKHNTEKGPWVGVNDDCCRCTE